MRWAYTLLLCVSCSRPTGPANDPPEDVKAEKTSSLETSAGNSLEQHHPEAPWGTPIYGQRVLKSNVLVYTPTVEQAYKVFMDLASQVRRRELFFDGESGEEVYWTDVHPQAKTQDDWDIVLTVWAVGGPDHPRMATTAKVAHFVIVAPEHLDQIAPHVAHLDESRIYPLDDEAPKAGLVSVLRRVRTMAAVETSEPHR